MKIESFELKVYEVGDVVDITDIPWRNSRYWSKVLDGAKWALIIGVNPLTDGTYNYRAIANTGNTITIRKTDIDQITYRGHIDVSLLFDEKEEEVEE